MINGCETTLITAFETVLGNIFAIRLITSNKKKYPPNIKSVHHFNLMTTQYAPANVRPPIKIITKINVHNLALSDMFIFAMKSLYPLGCTARM